MQYIHNIYLSIHPITYYSITWECESNNEAEKCICKNNLSNIPETYVCNSHCYSS